MRNSIAALCLTALLLAACGKQDMHSACFSNGDHENMSDGKITRICDCIEKGVIEQKPTEAETQSIIAWLNKKPLETNTTSQKERAQKITAYMMQLKTKCSAMR